LANFWLFGLNMSELTINNDLYGMYEATMDNKAGRFIVPADVAIRLGKMVRLTVDPLDRFIEVWPEVEFGKLVNRITASEATLPVEVVASLRMDYLGFSAEGQIDGSLRLVVPKRMRDILLDEDDLVLIGVKDHLQVWPAKTYRASRSTRIKEFAQSFPMVQALILGIERPVAAPVAAAPAVVADSSCDGENA